MMNSKLSLLFGFFAAIILAIGAQDYDDVGGDFQWKIDLTNLTDGQCVKSPELALNNLMWNLKFCRENRNVGQVNPLHDRVYGRISLQAIPNENIPYWTCQVEASGKLANYAHSIEIENATFSNLELEKPFWGSVWPIDSTTVFNFTLSMTPLDTRPPPSVPDTDSDSDADADIVHTGAKKFIELNTTELRKTGAMDIPVNNKVQGVQWNIQFELESGLHLLGFLKPNETNLKPNSIYEVNGIFKIISFNEGKPIIEQFEGELTNDSIYKSIRARRLHFLDISRHDEFIKNENMNIVVEFKVNKSKKPIEIPKKDFNPYWQILENNSKYYPIY